MSKSTVRLLLGNSAPVAHVAADADQSSTTRTSRPEVGKTVTYVSMRPDFADAKVAALALSTQNDPVLSMIGRRLAPQDRHYATGLRDVEDFWNLGHSDDPPEWVSCPDDPDFERVVADHFSSGDHNVSRGWAPGWRMDDTSILASGGVPADMLGAVPKAAISDIEDEGRRAYVQALAGGETPPPMAGGMLDRFEELNGLEPMERLGLAHRLHALMVNGGRDNGIRAMYDTTRTSILGPYNQMSLSANSAAESAANTALPGKITTAGGGLVVGAATYAHTAATATFTLTRTATANGSDSLPVTIAKIGLEDASANLGHEKLLSSTATLSASGDSIAVTFTGQWTPS